MVRFKPGQSYWARSVCDHDCIITVTVESRTRCYITTTEGKRLRVVTEEGPGCENVMPWGRYSMSPLIRAENVWTQ